MPCLVRRSAIKRGGHTDSLLYREQNLNEIYSRDVKDDLFAVLAAIENLKHRSVATWVMDSGPLPTNSMDDFIQLFVRGLNEIEAYLKGNCVQ